MTSFRVQHRLQVIYKFLVGLKTSSCRVPYHRNRLCWSLRLFHSRTSSHQNLDDNYWFDRSAYLFQHCSYWSSWLEFKYVFKSLLVLIRCKRSEGSSGIGLQRKKAKNRRWRWGRRREEPVGLPKNAMDCFWPKPDRTLVEAPVWCNLFE